MAITIKEIRENYPQYKDKSDIELADAIHAKYYSKLPKEMVYKKLDVNLGEPQEEQGFLSKALEGYKNYAKGAIKGQAQAFGDIGASAANTIPYLIEKLSGRKMGRIPHPDLLNPEATGAENIGQSLGQLVPSIVAPEAKLGLAGEALGQLPRAGSYIQKALAQGLPQAAIAALQSKESPGRAAALAGGTQAPFSILSEALKSGSPAVRTAGKIGGALAGGGLGYEVGKATGLPYAGSALGVLGAALGGRGMGSARNASEKIKKGIAGTPYAENIEAAERLGLSHLTPAEASENPFLAAMQGGLGKTQEGAKILYKKGEERLSSEESAINKLLDTTFKQEKLDPVARKMYEESYIHEVPTEKLAPFMENKVVQRAQRMVDNKPAYQESLKGISRNSIGYWDHVKQAMDDMIEKAPDKEARLIKQTKDKLVSEMDEVAPNYKEARSLWERKKTREDIEKVFNRKAMTGTSLYNGLLNNTKKFNEVRQKLRNVPEAQSQLDDMKKVFKNLVTVPTVKTAHALEKTSMNKPRSGAQYREDMLKDLLTNSKYDTSVIELITNPKWADEIHKLTEVSDKQKRAAQALNLLGKALAGEAGKH